MLYILKILKRYEFYDITKKNIYQKKSLFTLDFLKPKAMFFCNCIKIRL